jgi:hypothetical protein
MYCLQGRSSPNEYRHCPDSNSDTDHPDLGDGLGYQDDQYCVGLSFALATFKLKFINVRKQTNEDECGNTQWDGFSMHEKRWTFRMTRQLSNLRNYDTMVNTKRGVAMQSYL